MALAALRSHLRALGAAALLLAALPLLAVLFSVASAPSSLPPVAGATDDASFSRPPVIYSPRDTRIADSASSPCATVRGAADVYSSATPTPASDLSSQPTGSPRHAATSAASAISMTACDAEALESVKSIRASATVPLGAAATSPISTSSSPSPGRMLLVLSMVAAIVAAAGGLAARGGSNGQRRRRAVVDDRCQVCFMEKAVFQFACRNCNCDEPVCNLCLCDFVRDSHDASCKKPAARTITPLVHPHEIKIVGVVPEGYTHLAKYPPWYFVRSVKKNSRVHLFYQNLEDLEQGARPRAMEVIHMAYPNGLLSPAVRCDMYAAMRAFSEL